MVQHEGVPNGNEVQDSVGREPILNIDNEAYQKKCSAISDTIKYDELIDNAEEIIEDFYNDPKNIDKTISYKDVSYIDPLEILIGEIIENHHIPIIKEYMELTTSCYPIGDKINFSYNISKKPGEELEPWEEDRTGIITDIVIKKDRVVKFEVHIEEKTFIKASPNENEGEVHFYDPEHTELVEPSQVEKPDGKELALQIMKDLEKNEISYVDISNTDFWTKLTWGKKISKPDIKILIEYIKEQIGTLEMGEKVSFTKFDSYSSSDEGMGSMPIPEVPYNEYNTVKDIIIGSDGKVRVKILMSVTDVHQQERRGGYSNDFHASGKFHYIFVSPENLRRQQ